MDTHFLHSYLLVPARERLDALVQLLGPASLIGPLRWICVCYLR